MQLEPIKTEIPKIKIDPNAPMIVMKSPHGNIYQRGARIHFADALAVLVDFAPGAIVKWIFHYSEVHYVLSGKAKMTYRLSTDMFNKEHQMDAETGDCYVIPPGAEVEWKVDPSEPFRKLTITMPGTAPREMPPGTVVNVKDYSLG